MQEKNNNKILCFYHNADLDGMCSAAIVKYFEPSAVLVGLDYNYDFPWHIISSNMIVYMVDVSTNTEDMKKLKETVDKFIYIDHHISKINELKDKNLTFAGIQRSGIAACQLTWEWFSDNKCPKVIELLGNYDVFNLFENVLEFQYGMRSYDTDPNNIEFWKKCIENDDDKYIESIVNQGKTILKYLKTIDEKTINNNSFITYINGYKALVINSTNFTSMIFDNYQDIDDIDICVVFCWIKNQWKIGFYANNDNVDVSSIAKQYGGGGHKKAAGCFVNKLPDFINNVLYPQELSK